MNDIVTVVQDCSFSENIIFDARTYMHVQIGTMTSQFYRDIILKQHVRLFSGTMDAEFVFMDDNVQAS